jgi:hypothetical protein
MKRAIASVRGASRMKIKITTAKTTTLKTKSLPSKSNHLKREEIKKIKRKG